MDSSLLYHYWFRKRAGKSAPGKAYTGHFEDNIKGQTAGLILMGAGNTLRWRDNAELETLVKAIIDEIKDCGDDDGYLMAIPKEQFGTLEYPHYVRIWLTYGLYGAALGGNSDAMELLRRWQDWFNTCDDLPIIKYLSLSFQGVVCSPFVYNTPIGRHEDIDTTIQYYEEDWRLGQFIMRERNAIGTRNQPGREPHPHGTELEALEGYLDLYRATGPAHELREVSVFGNPGRKRKFERIYQRCLSQVERERDEIEEYIAGVQDSQMRQIIRLRFVEGLSWQAVADQVGGAKIV